ncbi:polysaccharide biosynthesis protein [Janibacter sp. CX7]|uniref:polysaccharide biosynthesis protein n=1 Tax=Janibacter sp. CX7 TaxID=2963431 RepID=UPI0020CEE03A|nr:nucleoside-diphosphate sugar epimerase/dehydratase [Janibacter sp. CX7]UTT66881.1 polysaccharide biosynthesis protein [Janibacter sp. CX7]
MGKAGATSASTRWRWAGIDGGLWIGATVAAVFLRFDFSFTEALASGTLLFALLSAAAYLALGGLAGPYAVGHSRGSFEEIVDLTKTALIVGLLGLVVNALLPAQLVPRSVPLTSALVAAMAMLAARTVLRTRRARHRATDDDRRVIVLGAGEGGRQLVRTMLRDPKAGLLPVALVDDDPAKARLSIDGVRVRGTRHDIAALADQTNASTVAVAIPSANSSLLAEVRELTRDAGLDVLVLPQTSELFRRPTGRDLRALDLADLLGRRPIELDSAAIAESINGKVVLVTGAGGSIGSELCRQIAKFGPRKLLLLDRDESALHATQISMSGRGLLDSDDTVLADIRDPGRLQEIFSEHRPQVVFHAAALKHLPLLERYPMEAWKTNVLGTLNVLQAASDHGVETFVNVSTDKAANPTSVLGYSKRLTERLTSEFAARDDNTYVSVRFGNVLGSRGSVITAFTAQIEAGGPVTVTHPEVERYFMLIPEACQLVLQAAAIGADGQVMVLDMGTPAKINDVATTLIDLSGRDDIEIVYTGLRPGEKLSEELFTPGEDIQQSAHPLVNHVDVAALTPHDVLAADSASDTVAYMRAEGLRGNHEVSTA